MVRDSFRLKAGIPMVGVISIGALWCCLALMWRYPEHLTTPYFYSADTARSFASFYIGMDWFIADLVVSSFVFIALERALPVHNQQVAREGWKTDLQYFAVNHLLLGVVIWPASIVAEQLCNWGALAQLRAGAAQLPFLVAVVAVFVLADLCQYWTHRMYHRVPFLWRIHSVHHSSSQLDWLSGSRQHIVELVITRSILLLPLVVVGFSPAVVLTFVVVGGLQAVLNHANVRLNLGWLEKWVVSPRFHRWHHSSDAIAANCNFAAHLAILDHLFGTAAPVERAVWPKRYGLMAAKNEV